MGRLKNFSIAVLIGLPGLVAPFMSAQAATYTPQEQANIKLVVDFDAALARGEAAHDLKRKIRSIVQQYLSADYIRHADDVPTYGPGPEEFIRRIQQKDPPPPLPEKVLTLMAHGDLVVRISSRSMPGQDSSAIYIFNMLRIQDGKVAEQWEAASDSLKILGPYLLCCRAGQPSQEAASGSPKVLDSGGGSPDAADPAAGEEAEGKSAGK